MSSDSEEYSDACDNPVFTTSNSSAVSSTLKARLKNGNLKEHLNTNCQFSTACNTSAFQEQHDVDEQYADPVGQHFPESTPSAPVKPEEDDAAREAEENSLSVEELEKRRSQSLDMKEEGNGLFKVNKYTEAIDRYTLALLTCPIRFKKERSIFYSNRAVCHAKMDAPESAISDCDAALSLQPDYIRCLERRADLLEQRDRLTEAFEDYKKLLELDPGNAKARFACMSLPDRIKAQQEKMKEEMLGQLKQLGNMVLSPFGLSTNNFKLTKNPDSEGYSVQFSR